MQSVILFDKVSKRYRKYRSNNIRETLARASQKLIHPTRRKDDNSEWFWAVKDLSIQVEAGQTLGIIGPNGAGKTTVLKLLSGITQPTSGKIQANGRVSALIELGAGFHPELTGRENVYLNGTILGLSRREIAQRFSEIVDFAGLSTFIDTPVKYYSSGMYARLGFSVAAHTNPDLLLVDEVLAVGDYSFQQQCYQHMRLLQKRGTSILFVSHNLTAIADICDGVLVMNRGQPVFHGQTVDGLAMYAEVIRQNVSSKDQLRIGEDGIAQRVMTHQAIISDVCLFNHDSQPVKSASSGDRVYLTASVQFLEDAPHPHFSCFVHDGQGRLIYDQTTLWQGVVTPNYFKGQTARIIYELRMNVVEGIYTIGMDLHYADLSCYYDRIESAATLVVDGKKGAKGIADLECQFKFE
jgi:ABC-type polysaccharide/polyol phosphate transport system ATPase subunit